MGIYKLGLILNFTGSIFLGAHIIGIERLKRGEKFFKKLPDKIVNVPIFGVFNVFFRTIIKTETKKFHKIKKMETERFTELLGKRLEQVFTAIKSRDLSKILKDPATFILFFGGIFWIGILLLIFPLILVIALFVRLLGWLQKKTGIESIFGILGIIFLSIGFILQFIAI